MAVNIKKLIRVNINSFIKPSIARYSNIKFGFDNPNEMASTSADSVRKRPTCPQLCKFAYNNNNVRVVIDSQIKDANFLLSVR